MSRGERPLGHQVVKTNSHYMVRHVRFLVRVPQLSLAQTCAVMGVELCLWSKPTQLCVGTGQPGSVCRVGHEGGCGLSLLYFLISCATLGPKLLTLSRDCYSQSHKSGHVSSV